MRVLLFGRGRSGPFSWGGIRRLRAGVRLVMRLIGTWCICIQVVGGCFEAYFGGWVDMMGDHPLTSLALRAVAASGLRYWGRFITRRGLGIWYISGTLG